MRVHWRILFLGRQFAKNIYRGELPEREGAWTVCRLKGRLRKEEEDGVFEGGGGWYPMPTMSNIPGIEPLMLPVKVLCNESICI